MTAQILEQTKRHLQLIKSDATSPRYPPWFITPEPDKSHRSLVIQPTERTRARD
jgi:hypothetical protein